MNVQNELQYCKSKVSFFRWLFTVLAQSFRTRGYIKTLWRQKKRQKKNNKVQRKQLSLYEFFAFLVQETRTNIMYEYLEWKSHSQHLFSVLISFYLFFSLSLSPFLLLMSFHFRWCMDKGFIGKRQWFCIVISTAIIEPTAGHTVKFTGCLANGKSSCFSSCLFVRSCRSFMNGLLP